MHGLSLSRRSLLGLTALAVSACSSGQAGENLTSPSSTASPDVVPDLPPPTPTTSAPVSPTPTPPNLVGDTHNTWVFAPVGRLDNLVTEGSVPYQRAWSTSKVLVVTAFLQTVARGDPTRLTSGQAARIDRVLSESHLPSLQALKAEIPGHPGAVMTKILRSIGDAVTVAPDSYEGTMTWTAVEQVRFMSGLATGAVVTPAASAYVLERMHPVASQGWGLPSVGATAAKGGWLRSDTETRQMGLLRGYAVALVTSGVGPVVEQSDGDSAHVDQMNQLAAALSRRLGS